jgi:hypothetical protein
MIVSLSSWGIEVINALNEFLINSDFTRLNRTREIYLDYKQAKEIK